MGACSAGGGGACAQQGGGGGARAKSESERERKEGGRTRTHRVEREWKEQGGRMRGWLRRKGLQSTCTIARGEAARRTRGGSEQKPCEKRVCETRAQLELCRTTTYRPLLLVHRVVVLTRVGYRPQSFKNATTSVFTSINSSRYLNLSEGEGDSRPQRFLVRAWHAVQIRRVHRPLHVERVPCKHIGRDTAKKIR